MKHIVFASLLLPSLLVAQAPQPIPIRQIQPRAPQTASDALPDNYQVTLTIADKDGQPIEVSVVVASTQFNASLGEPSLAFSGTISIEESSGIIIAYALAWETPITVGNNTQYKTSSTQGSVRLKLGEEVQIIRAGTRTARLSIKKLDVVKPK
jgi:hypothetical protein